MNTKLCFILALCIYQAAAVTYHEAVEKCKKEAHLTNDAPIDHFFQTGSFPAGSDNLSCFFNCVGKHMGALDSNGVPNQYSLDEASKENPDSTELFALKSAYSACSVEAKAALPGCSATQLYATCAVQHAARTS